MSGRSQTYSKTQEGNGIARVELDNRLQREFLGHFADFDDELS